MPLAYEIINGTPHLNTGAMRHQITIQQQDKTRGAYGEEQSIWNDLLTTMACIEDATESEVISPIQITSQFTHLVTIRYRPDLAGSFAPGQRIVYGARMFRVQNPRNVNSRNVAVEFRCEELYGNA